MPPFSILLQLLLCYVFSLLHPDADRMKRSTKKSVVSVDDDPQAHAVLYELKYSGRVGYGLALQIRGDGGVSAKYPDGSTAVAVESAIDGGKIVYTMMAMYPGKIQDDLILYIYYHIQNVCNGCHLSLCFL